MLFKKLTTLTLTASCILTGCFTEKETANETASEISTSTNTLNTPISENYVLLDVRTPTEYTRNGLKEATLIPYDTIYQKITNVTTNKATPIKLYCHSGRRAIMAIETLTKMGYTNLENLQTVEKAKVYVVENPIN